MIVLGFEHWSISKAGALNLNTLFLVSAECLYDVWSIGTAFPHIPTNIHPIHIYTTLSESVKCSLWHPLTNSQQPALIFPTTREFIQKLVFWWKQKWIEHLITRPSSRHNPHLHSLSHWNGSLLFRTTTTKDWSLQSQLYLHFSVQADMFSLCLLLLFELPAISYVVFPDYLDFSQRKCFPSVSLENWSICHLFCGQINFNFQSQLYEIYIIRSSATKIQLL